VFALVVYFWRNQALCIHMFSGVYLMFSDSHSALLLPLEKQCTDRDHCINYSFSWHTQKVTVFSLKLT